MPSRSTRRSRAGAAPRQHAAAVVGARRRPAVARRLQPRRPRRRAGGPRAPGGDLARAVSERRDRRRAGPAPAPGILLRVGVAAGPRAPAPCAARRLALAARPRGDPAERHASGDRRAGADAPARRRARHAVGHAHGTSPRASSTTRTTRCCRRRSRPGRSRSSTRCCRATCRSSTRINAQHLDALRAAGAATADLCFGVADRRDGSSSASGWGIWRSSARIASTACRRCTPNSCAQTVFRDLHALHPDKIVNKTNGITFRRWLFEANPALTSLLVDARRTARCWTMPTR